MEETVDIDFYRERDEGAFLDSWESAHGEISDDELDELYAKIASDIHQKIQSGEHELGDLFVYEGVPVGESDYNEFHNLYLFKEPKTN